MEDALKNVADMFELAKLELDCLENQLAKDLREKVNVDICLVSLLARLQRLAARVPAACSRASQLNDKQKALQRALCAQAQHNAGLCAALHASCGTHVAPMSTPLQAHVASTKQLQSTDSGGRSSLQQRAQDQPQTKKKQKGFLPVSQEQWDSVGSTVKGRLKRSQLNEFYEVIYNAFQRDASLERLTVKQLSERGAKSGGLKGQNALHSLRQLKLITIGKAGISIPDLGKRSRKKSRR